MENDDFYDGSAIGGLTISELDEYSTRSYVPKQTREARVTSLNHEEEDVIILRRRAALASSLFMLLSVYVKPRESSSSLLSVYGEITSFSGCFPYKSDYLYKRESQDAETFSGSDGGGYLTLNGPSSSCMPCDAHFLFQSRELSIRLYDQQGKHLYPLVDDDDHSIILDYSPDDFFEQVTEKVVENSEISLTFKYVSIPMAVFGCLHFSIFKWEGRCQVSKYVDVRGKVVAKYKNTLGNYKSEEIVLFDKNPEHEYPEYDSVVLDTSDYNLLASSRGWVAAPAYSSLQLHIDLFDCQEGTRLIEDVELETGSSCSSSTELVFGQYFLEVCALWCRPPSRLPRKDGRDVQISRTLKACTPQLSPSTAIEVFSVLGFYNNTSLRIHGRLQFSFYRTGKFCEDGVDIIKREKEDPLFLPRGGYRIPLRAGSRFLDSFFPLSVVCDLKDTEGRLNIKGHQILNDLKCFDTELCSIFRGDHGFASLHYAIFPSAVQANLEVFVRQPFGLLHRVRGRICVRYKGFDYSTKYKMNSYRIILHAVPCPSYRFSKGKILLSRTSFVVPSYSSAILDLDLHFVFDSLPGEVEITGEMEFAIGRSLKIIQRRGIEFLFVMKWSNVK